MADIKDTTVRYLRELARKHLGKGHSRLKTKDELWAALKKAVPEVLHALGGGAEKKAPRTTGARDSKATTPAAPSRAAPAEVVRFSSSKVAARTVLASGGTAPPAVGAQPSATPLGTRPAEPVSEGFFVAKVAGLDEARRHHLTGSHPPPAGPPVYDERLGELPQGYLEDEVVLLARDPSTLFAFWDFRPGTREDAMRGLPEPRAKLRIFEGGRLVREDDFALESKCFYLHGLPSGRRYRAEIHFVGADGQSKRLGPSSNAVALPAYGPSEDTSVRFLRVPWDAALVRLREALRQGQAALRQELEPRRYIEWVWTRVALPGSAGFRDEASPRVREEWPTPPGPVPPAHRYVPTPSGMGVSSQVHSPSGSGRHP